MIAIDTSVAVAAFATWHEGHLSARRVLARAPRIPAHAWIETFSVLTRLPAPQRAEPEIVQRFLEGNFDEPPLTLPATGYRSIVRAAASSGLRGGSIYDAVIAATVRRAKAKLISRDRRAAEVYATFGINYEILA